MSPPRAALPGGNAPARPVFSPRLDTVEVRPRRKGPAVPGGTVPRYGTLLEEECNHASPGGVENPDCPAVVHVSRDVKVDRRVDWIRLGRDRPRWTGKGNVP